MDTYREERVELRERFLRSQSRKVYEQPITRISTVRQYLEHEYYSKRGGVILVSNVDRRTNYGLGIDCSTNELTDFGGKIRPHENSIEGALREFREETLGIFDTPPLEELQDCIVVHNSEILVLFIRVQIKPIDICKAFTDALFEAVATKKKTEVTGMMFFTEADFRELLHRSHHIYSRLGWFLCGAGDFFSRL